MEHAPAFDTLQLLQLGVDHLNQADPRLQELIQTFGAPERLLTKATSSFRSLAKSILYQQLAGSAAAAIYSRFLAVCQVPDESQLTPAAVLAASPAALRGCGLSERKASYLQDLAAHFQDGRLSDELLTGLSESELHTTLTAVRGVGPWTVDMFSIFHLGRPDVLPTGDLGVRKGLAALCGLSHMPSPDEMKALTAAWRPYRSLGSYYMWRMPLPPAKRPAAGSSKARSTAGTKAKAAKAAAVASPLGAAVAAVADVGVDVGAPMLAAASGSTAASAAAAATAAAAAASAAAGSVAVVASVMAGAAANININRSAEVVDEQQQQQAITPAKLMQAPGAQLATGNGAANGNSGAAAAGDGGGAGQAADGGGMMTRRRLRWAGNGSSDGNGFKARSVDL